MTTPYDVARGMVGLDANGVAARLQQQLGRPLTMTERLWCADFVKGTAQAAGVDVTGANSAARSFLNVGQPTAAPQQGSIAVLSRPGGGEGSGHVGYYDGRNADGTIRILSGNSGGGVVKFSNYPADRVLEYRNLPGAQPFNGFSGPADGSPRGAQEAGIPGSQYEINAASRSGPTPGSFRDAQETMGPAGAPPAGTAHQNSPMKNLFSGLGDAIGSQSAKAKTANDAMNGFKPVSIAPYQPASYQPIVANFGGLG